MSTKIVTLTFILIGFLSLSSCKFDVAGIKGEGPVTEETYEIDQKFDKLSAHKAWNVELIKSDKPRLIVKTQENIHPLFKYKIENGKLSLSIKGNKNVQNVKEQSVKVYYKNLSEIKASSASSIFCTDTFDQKDLNLKASSAGNIKLHLKTAMSSASASSSGKIELSGTSISFKGRASSAGRVDAKNLKTKTSDVGTSSAGRVSIYALDSLKAKASSAGKVLYVGKPKKTTLKESSSGKIEHQD